MKCPDVPCFLQYTIKLNAHELGGINKENDCQGEGGSSILFNSEAQPNRNKNKNKQQQQENNNDNYNNK